MYVVFVELEGRGFRSIQYLQALRQQFNLTGEHLWIMGALGTNSQKPLDLDHVFVSERLRLGEHGGIVRVEHNLQHTFLITQIDKNYAAMVSPAVDPPANTDLLIDLLSIEFTTIMRPHSDLSE